MTLVGWCPGGRPVTDMLKTYPGTGTARIFVGKGKPIPTWDGPVLGPLVAAGVKVVHLSVKDPDWPAVRRLIDAKPAGLLLILTFGHEPEQGTKEGDLPIDQWRARWAELVALLADHPARGELLLVPVYTRVWWERNAGDRRWMLDLPVDAIGWDIYSSALDRYRTPDDLLTIPRAVAEQTGLPYLVPELGAVRIAGDKDGSGQQGWMRAMVDAVKGDGALTCCWFHKDGWDLLADGAEAARQTWQTIITEEAAMAWSKGQPWRTVRSLDRLNEQVRARYPRAVPPATDPNSWGALADGAHSMTSDHYPHFYAALGKTAVVTARDFPHAPELGLDFGQVAEELRLSRDPRIKYVIFDGRMFSSYASGGYAPFTWRPYSGPDMHRTHGHVSSVSTAAADDPRDWQISNGVPEDDMSAEAENQIANLYSAVFRGGPSMGRSVDPDGSGGRSASNAIVAKLDYLLTRVDELAAQGQADVQRDTALAGRVDKLAADVTARVLAALPAGTSGTVERKELEAAVVAGVRSALGSLDGATPQQG